MLARSFSQSPCFWIRASPGVWSTRDYASRFIRTTPAELQTSRFNVDRCMLNRLTKSECMLQLVNIHTQFLNGTGKFWRHWNTRLNPSIMWRGKSGNFTVHPLLGVQSKNSICLLCYLQVFDSIMVHFNIPFISVRTQIVNPSSVFSNRSGESSYS